MVDGPGSCSIGEESPSIENLRRIEAIGFF
jgi:hypothetical protein